MSQSGVYNTGGPSEGAVLGLLADNAVVVPPNPITGDITIHGGTGVSTIGNAGAYTLTINATGSGAEWNDISASQTLDVNNNYMCSGGTNLSLALPLLSAFGDEIIVVLDGSTSFTITQDAGQQIRIGDSTTTLGATGTLATTQQGDAIKIVCKSSNLTWTVLDSMGNLEIV